MKGVRVQPNEEVSLGEASKQRSSDRTDRMGNTKAWGRDNEACFFCGVEFDPKDLDKNN